MAMGALFSLNNFCIFRSKFLAEWLLWRSLYRFDQAETMIVTLSLFIQLLKTVTKREDDMI